MRALLPEHGAREGVRSRSRRSFILNDQTSGFSLNVFQKRVRHIGACWFGSVGADTPLIKEGRGQEAVCANMTLHLLLNKSGTKESAVMKYHEHHRREPTNRCRDGWSDSIRNRAGTFDDRTGLAAVLM